MADQTGFAATTARALIEQCRRDIESGWQHVEAAREILRRTRWLVPRWEAQRRAIAQAQRAGLPKREPAREMFIPVDPPPRRGRRGTRSGVDTHPA
jgi:hypothetical protein